MGHEITEYDRTFSVREMPWMGLLDGRVSVLPENPTRREAQDLVHPWEPIEQPVFRRRIHLDYEGKFEDGYEEIEGSKAIERSDNGNLLGVVNESLGIVTNEEMWDVAEAVMSTGDDIRIETGGSLDSGRKVWALLKFDEPIMVNGDPNGLTMPFFALQNSHNGSGSFRGQAINTRIVCANTSAAADIEAKRSGYEFTFRHTSRINERIEDAKRAVILWREGVVSWQSAMEHLIGAEVTREQVWEYVTLFQPMPPEALITERVRGNVNTARAELVSILNGPTCGGISKTAYGLVQASMEWRQHYQKVKGSSERTKMESRFKRSMLTQDRFGTDVVALARHVAKV